MEKGLWRVMAIIIVVTALPLNLLLKPPKANSLFYSKASQRLTNGPTQILDKRLWWMLWLTCWVLEPISVVEGEGFRSLMALAEPRFAMPSRSHLTAQVIPSMYNTMREQVTKEISQSTCVALTSDMWTSRATENYTTVTAHFITSLWELKTYVLETTFSSVSHTSDHLSRFFQDVMIRWNILCDDELKPSITTDNAVNITKAVVDSGSTHIG